MQKFMGLCEQDKPAGFLRSVVGECHDPSEDPRTVQLFVGWESIEAHLGAKGTSPERNEVAKTLLSMGPKPITVSLSTVPCSEVVRLIWLTRFTCPSRRSSEVALELGETLELIDLRLTLCISL